MYYFSILLTVDRILTFCACGLWQSMLLLDAFNKDRASLPQPLANPPALAPLSVAAPEPRIQEMINEKLKKAEDLGKLIIYQVCRDIFS